MVPDVVRPMSLPSKETSLAAAAALLAATGALGLGASVGRMLLDSMNDSDAPVLAALAAHADPEGGGGRAAVTSHETGAGAGGDPHRLVVVVLDGLGEAGFSEAVEQAHPGEWQWRATVDMGTPSLSRPVYHVLFTGVPQAVSGIRNNTHAGRARADDLATRVREAGGTVGWALEGVPWFHDLFGRPGDAHEIGWPRRAEERFGPMADILAQSPTFAVLHFIEIDHAGHAHGAASEEYRRAAREALQAVIGLREAHAATAAGARTVWMLGADHGHRAGGGHGGPEPEVVRTTWIGLWPSAPRGGAARAEGGAPAEGPERVEISGVVPADRLAATFAAILGVASPRMALGEPLPLPDRPAAASPDRARRRAAVQEAVTTTERVARRGVLLRAGLFLVGLVGILAVVARGRRAPPGAGGAVARMFGAASPTLGAIGAFFALGPGATLSAIATKEGFLARSISVMAAGAALGFLVARRWRAPLRWVFLASGVLPAAAFVAAAGSMGQSRLPDGALLIFPTTGLLPWGVVAGTVVGAGAAAALGRWRRRGEPLATGARPDPPREGPAGTEAGSG